MDFVALYIYWKKWDLKNIKIINEEISGIVNDDGGLNTNKMWKLKKKLCPQIKDPPSAKMDDHGNFVTTEY